MSVNFSFHVQISQNICTAIRFRVLFWIMRISLTALVVCCCRSSFFFRCIFASIAYLFINNLSEVAQTEAPVRQTGEDAETLHIHCGGISFNCGGCDRDPEQVLRTELWLCCESISSHSLWQRLRSKYTFEFNFEILY